jgi:hypothetical protein
MAEANITAATNPTAMLVAERIGHRFALVTILIFLVIGLMTLLFVDEKEGRLVAQRKDTEA